MADSILFPVSAATYKKGYSGMCGAKEVDVETGDLVWQFNIVESDLEMARLVNAEKNVEQEGFRPTSVERLDNGLTMICGWKSVIWVDEDGDITRIQTHDHINDAHEAKRTPDGNYLVASTGMDTILEFDEDWNEVWEWNMWKHVSKDLYPGDYYPNRLHGTDARFVAGMPDDRFHVNYATVDSNGDILASALNYGFFIIDRETNSIKWEYTDISHCHNPTEYKDGYVVAESGKNRIVKVDKHGEMEVMFEQGLSFPKDADYIEKIDSWLVTDTKNDRIILYPMGEEGVKKMFQLPEKAVPYESDYLTGGLSYA